MPISFVRIDDRVIHGQIVARWSKLKPCNGILVIDDKIAQDPLQKEIFKHAAPSNIKVGVYTAEEGVEKVNKAKQAKNSYFVIVKSPVTLKKLIELGGDFGTELNVGPMSARGTTQTIGKNVSITEEEKEAFDYLQNKGINIIFQLVPEETPVKWEKLKTLYKGEEK